MLVNWDASLPPWPDELTLQVISLARIANQPTQVALARPRQTRLALRLATTLRWTPAQATALLHWHQHTIAAGRAPFQCDTLATALQLTEPYQMKCASVPKTTNRGHLVEIALEAVLITRFIQVQPFDPCCVMLRQPLRVEPFVQNTTLQLLGGDVQHTGYRLGQQFKIEAKMKFAQHHIGAFWAWFCVTLAGGGKSISLPCLQQADPQLADCQFYLSAGPQVQLQKGWVAVDLALFGVMHGNV